MALSTDQTLTSHELRVKCHYLSSPFYFFHLSQKYQTEVDVNATTVFKITKKPIFTAFFGTFTILYFYAGK